MLFFMATTKLLSILCNVAEFQPHQHQTGFEPAFFSQMRQITKLFISQQPIDFSSCITLSIDANMIIDAVLTFTLIALITGQMCSGNS